MPSASLPHAADRVPATEGGRRAAFRPAADWMGGRGRLSSPRPLRGGDAGRQMSGDANVAESAPHPNRFRGEPRGSSALRTLVKNGERGTSASRHSLETEICAYPRLSRAGIPPRGVSALVALAVVLMTLFVSSVPALAHATLVRSEPVDGSVVASAPRRFTLTFSEPVSPLVLRLVDPDGASHALTDYLVEGEQVGVAAPTLGGGTHVLSWRVVSADGHPIGGSVVFSVGAPSAGGTPDVSESVDQPLRMAIWAARFCLYAGLFFGVGGVFFQAWVAAGSASARGFVSGMLALGFATAPLSAGLQGLDALGLPLAALAGSSIWDAGLSTSYGITAIAAFLVLCIASAALVLDGVATRVLALAGIVGVGLALATSGHASAAEPQWLMRPAVFLHGVGIAYWTGAMVPLAVLLFRRDRDAVAALFRFSHAAPFAIAPLVVAGVVLAVVQVQTPAALVETAYGDILLAKLALVLVLFALAAINRWWLAGPVKDGDAQATRRLARSVATETLVIALILGAAAVWRFTPPPRVLAIEAAMPASVHIHAEKAMADLSVAPGKAGPVDVSIFVMTGDFGPLDAKEVTLVLSKPDAGIEPMKRSATAAEGAWRIDGLQIPVAGRWKVRLDVLVSDFEMAKLEGEIEIRP